jgi:surfactin synthase thioesterase subunit
MSPAVEVLAVQYPGRQDRSSEPCLDDLAVLADQIAEQLQYWTDRPVALFGHSMGATVAFEVARRLEKQEIGLVRLYASGRRAPSRQRAERLHLSTDAELLNELVRLSGTDPQVLADEAIVRMVLPPMRADYRAIETYRYLPGPPLSCPISALTGDDDPLLDLDEVQAWDQHTAASFGLRVFAGGHFFLNEHQPAITAQINADLEAASIRR